MHSPVEVLVEDDDFDISVQKLQELINNKDIADLADCGGPSGVARKLRVEPERGVQSARLEKYREQFGRNVIPRHTLRSYFSYLLDAANDFIIILLTATALVLIIIWAVLERDTDRLGWVEGVSIAGTVTLVLNLNAWQDWSKHQKLDKLEQEGENVNVTVVRDDRVQQVLNKELVVGDVVRINVGDILQADGILLHGSDVECDESALTGEPINVKKGHAAPFLQSGCSIQKGQGAYLVLAVGTNSQMGQIHAIVLGLEQPENHAEQETGSPLQRKLMSLAKMISVVATILAIVALLGMALRFTISDIILGAGWIPEHGQVVVSWFLTSLTILVVAIPEGLPLAVSLSLSLSVGKMLKQHNLVKQLNSTETMGSATAICSDKTGTLTQNRMSVVRCQIGELSARQDMTTCGQQLAQLERGTKALELVALNICLNRAEAEIEWNAQTACWTQTGNKTDCALLAFAHDCGFKYHEIQARDEFYTESAGMRVLGARTFPFSSLRKRAGIVVPHGDGYRLYVKGAPEMIFALCTQAVDCPFMKDDILKKVATYAHDALRTIAFAYRDFDTAQLWDEVLSAQDIFGQCSETYYIESNLTFCGIVGIEDPIRPSVRSAIKKCNAAGIDVRMVTGDNIDTAVAIAKQCGIIRDGDMANEALLPGVAMTGPEFRRRVLEDGNIRQAAFDEVWPSLRVLARSSPIDKYHLVLGMQQSTLYSTSTGMRLGLFPDRQVVAVTGDGTNDAPALKQADIGFAMGITGTSVAKDAADIILLDDDFASIVTACLWGRNVYDCISKFLQFQLTVNVVAVSLAVIGAFAFADSPLSTVQLLWINVIMDTLGAFALASEPPDETILRRPPYGRKSSLLSTYMVVNIVGQSAYQLTVLLIVLFVGAGETSRDGQRLPILPSPDSAVPLLRAPGGIFFLASGNDRDATDTTISIHYSFIFNVFVLMQFANWINARKLYHEWNVFDGLHRNQTFLIVWLACMLFQVFLVEIGRLTGDMSIPAHVPKNGTTTWELNYFDCNNHVVSTTCLPPRLWAYSLAFAGGTFLWQLVIILLCRCIFADISPHAVTISTTFKVTSSHDGSGTLQVLESQHETRSGLQPVSASSSEAPRSLSSQSTRSLTAIVQRSTRLQSDFRRSNQLMRRSQTISKFSEKSGSFSTPLEKLE